MVPPMDNADTQYRTLRQHALVPDNRTKVTDEPLPVLDGTFSPGKIAVFDPLSQVPLGPYQPTVAAPSSPASRKALGGGDLLPDLNMGGLVTQPVQLITTLAALPTLENSDYTGDAQLARAPISVIRVRVGRRHRPQSGLAQPDQDGRRADRAPHPPDRGHRRGVIPGAHYGRGAGRPVRDARAAAQRGLGRQGRRDQHPDRR